MDILLINGARRHRIKVFRLPHRIPVTEARKCRAILGGAIRGVETDAHEPLTLKRGHDQIGITFTIEA